ncbi:hypothetical protein YC2023_002888 [Brassica napus]
MGIEDADNNDTNNNKVKDTLPFACFICKELFIDPIVTKCNEEETIRRVSSREQGNKVSAEIGVVAVLLYLGGGLVYVDSVPPRWLSDQKSS